MSNPYSILLRDCTQKRVRTLRSVFIALSAYLSLIFLLYGYDCSANIILYIWNCSFKFGMLLGWKVAASLHTKFHQILHIDLHQGHLKVKLCEILSWQCSSKKSNIKIKELDCTKVINQEQ